MSETTVLIVPLSLCGVSAHIQTENKIYENSSIQ